MLRSIISICIAADLLSLANSSSAEEMKYRINQSQSPFEWNLTPGESSYGLDGRLIAQADTADTGSDGTDEAAQSDMPGGYTQEQINEMINNPLGEL
jgi:hypothetical protein